MTCSLGRPYCRVEFALSESQANDVFRKAEKLSPSKSPYGIPVYPYVWEVLSPELGGPDLSMDMGTDDHGHPVRANFFFDRTRRATFQPMTAVRVHVEVALFLGDGEEQHSMDGRMHYEAAKHVRGGLLGLSVSPYLPAVREENPPLDEGTETRETNPGAS